MHVVMLHSLHWRRYQDLKIQDGNVSLKALICCFGYPQTFFNSELLLIYSKSVNLLSV